MGQMKDLDEWRCVHVCEGGCGGVAQRRRIPLPTEADGGRAALVPPSEDCGHKEAGRYEI